MKVFSNYSIIIIILFVCVGDDGYMHTCCSVLQRSEEPDSQFSPTMWLPGLELRLSEKCFSW